MRFRNDSCKLKVAHLNNKMQSVLNLGSSKHSLKKLRYPKGIKSCHVEHDIHELSGVYLLEIFIYMNQTW